VATFSEAVQASSISATTVTLTSAAGGAVVAMVGYDGATRTATLDPNEPLLAGPTYTATVRGGAGGVKDLAGNPLASDVT
jgi:hypothetical protein